MMKPDTSSTLTMEEEDVDMSGRASPAFITVENEKGVLEHVQVSWKWKSSVESFLAEVHFFSILKMRLS